MLVDSKQQVLTYQFFRWLLTEHSENYLSSNFFMKCYYMKC